MSLLVSGDGTAPLTINQDARIFAGNLNKDKSIAQHLNGDAYLVVVAGQLEIDGIVLTKGDGAEITDTDTITIHACTESKLLLIEI